MTSEGVFTAAELMEMLLNPERRRSYLYIGLQRSEETPRPQAAQNVVNAALPNPAAGAAMPELRPAEVIREERGYFVFNGRGWGHGVGLSQWGAMAMAREGWTAERILAHYYPGTTIMRIR
jgi:stage II sporulation protein D